MNEYTLNNDFYKINQGEAYKKSRYIDQEMALTNFFKHQLINLGYTTTDPFDRAWKRNGKTVVVCLSDDYYSNLSEDVKENPDTIVITDNFWVNTPKHKIFKLPNSYFGIYEYTPTDFTWAPERRVNFSINRFSYERLLIMLELIEQSGSVSSVLEKDFLNFNGFMPRFENTKIENRIHNFDRQWQTVEREFRLRYQDYTDVLRSLLPIKNHDCTHEHVHVASWVNMVVETYAGDTNRTFSEKTFRALVTPVPWTLYAGHKAIELLNELGFDTLKDLVDHRYDRLLEAETLSGIDKIQQYVFVSLYTYQTLLKADFKKLKNRCEAAATHNQQMLAKMRQQWPVDFAKWWPTVIEHIA